MGRGKERELQNDCVWMGREECSQETVKRGGVYYLRRVNQGKVNARKRVVREWMLNGCISSGCEDSDKNNKWDISDNRDSTHNPTAESP